VGKKRPLSDTWICALGNRKKKRGSREGAEHGAASILSRNVTQKGRALERAAQVTEESLPRCQNSGLGHTIEINNQDTAGGKPAARDSRVNG
jgi:hypothetical protein